MAVKKIPVPFCDWCGLPFLPKFKLKDGTPNPIFDHPERSKRCGKCKRTGWNAGGVDRRRKNPVTFLADPEDGPVVGIVEAETYFDIPVHKPRSHALIENLPQVSAQDVVQTIDIAPRARRCRHGLFKCDKCRPVTA